MTSVSTVEARSSLEEVINRVCQDGERVILTRSGQPVAVLVSVEDAELIRAIEDHIDLEACREALAEPGENIPWEKVRKELDLT